MKSLMVILDRSPGIRTPFRRMTGYCLVTLPPGNMPFFPTENEKPQQGYFLGRKEGHLKICTEEKQKSRRHRRTVSSL